MIREATLDDVNAITRLGIEALSRDRPKQMLISRDKIRAMIITIINEEKHFGWVAEEDGEVVAGVGALVHEMLFFERQQCSVVMYYCNKPGAGIALLRHLMKWAKSKSYIKMIEFTLERTGNERVKKLLGRLGLTESLPILMHIK